MPVPTVTASYPANCTHERRPGITVCLLCRREAREAAQRRHRKMFARLAAMALGLFVMTVLVVAATSTWRARRATPTTPVSTTADTSAVPVATPTPTPTPSAPTSESEPTTTLATSSAPVAELPAAIVPPAARAVVAPIIAEGRSQIAESVFAVRTGDTVRVVFDTQMGRTRRPEKFERIVRETLPAVYGPAADSALATIRPGALTGSSDLLGDLPTRGLEIRLAAGHTLAVWPELRPGRDGPLVVMYRAVVRN